MSEQEASDDGKTTERWVYLGRHWNYGTGKMQYGWRDHNGETRFWSKATATVPGGIYEVITSTDGKSMYIHGTPRWTGDSVEDELSIKAQDRDALRTQESKRAEARAAKLAVLDDAVNMIAPHVRNHRDVSAFIGYMMEELYKKSFQRRKHE